MVMLAKYVATGSDIEPSTNAVAEIGAFPGRSRTGDVRNTRFQIELDQSPLDNRPAAKMAKAFGTDVATVGRIERTVDGDLVGGYVHNAPPQRQVPGVPLPARKSNISQAQRVLRMHFVSRILDLLVRISDAAETPKAADYAHRLFTVMRQSRDTAQKDPFLAVIMALHDALAYENHWSQFTGEQYEQARTILTKYANQDIFPEKAEKAIMELEDAGFDTTPFVAEVEDDG